MCVYTYFISFRIKGPKSIPRVLEKNSESEPHALRIEIYSLQDRATVNSTTMCGPVDGGSVGGTIHCGTIRGSTIRSCAIRSSTIRGSAIRSSAIRDSAIRDSAIRGSTIRGSAIRSNAIRTHIMPTRDPVLLYQLDTILLFEKVHPTGRSFQPIPTLTSRPTSPTHRSSITQSSRDTASYTRSAPPLPLWRWRVVQSQLLSDQRDLGMISRVPHATTPGHLVVLEQEFSPDLSEVAAGQHFPARLQLLEETLYGHGQERALHIFRRLAWVQGAGHAEEVIYSPCRIGVDGEGTCCCFSVHGYEVRLTTADDDDFGGWRECGEGLGGNGGCEGTEVFLAVL